MCIVVFGSIGFSIVITRRQPPEQLSQKKEEEVDGKGGNFAFLDIEAI